MVMHGVEVDGVDVVGDDVDVDGGVVVVVWEPPFHTLPEAVKPSLLSYNLQSRRKYLSQDLKYWNIRVYFTGVESVVSVSTAPVGITGVTVSESGDIYRISEAATSLQP